MWMQMKLMSALLFSLFQAVGGWRRSPSSRSSSRAESSEDLLSDTASVASDISDSSLNSSLLGKRTLVPPTKVTHLFKTDSARFIREMFMIIFIMFLCISSLTSRYGGKIPHSVFSVRGLWGTCQVWKLHPRRAGGWLTGRTHPHPRPRCPASTPAYLSPLLKVR